MVPVSLLGDCAEDKFCNTPCIKWKSTVASSVSCKYTQIILYCWRLRQILDNAQHVAKSFLEPSKRHYFKINILANDCTQNQPWINSYFTLSCQRNSFCVCRKFAEIALNSNILASSTLYWKQTKGTCSQHESLGPAGLPRGQEEA